MASRCGAYYDGVLRVIWAGSPPVVLIAGEIDRSRYSGLVSALEGLAGHEGDVHVNLAELVFCDLAGLRAILRLARTGRADEDHGRRRLVLHDVPPHLRRVLEILGWDCTPGLIMNEPAQQTVSPSGNGLGSASPQRGGYGIDGVLQRARARLIGTKGTGPALHERGR
jgi:anti-anti-sigma regulatory factor